MKAMEELKGKVAKDRGNILVKVLRAQQKIELLKIPTFVELANEYLSQGFNVVIFVNFTQTLNSLSKLLLTKCLIYGEQTDTERQFNIEEFQSDRQRIIICNIKAGGVGISLHDINGQYKRVSLISPCWSAIDLTQALGRIHRAGAKSKALQRIIYCDNTIENNIADKLRIKLGNLQSINNGDLSIDLKDIEYIKKPKQLKE
jgi:SNF2 family DNA or RNA helicase